MLRHILRDLEWGIIFVIVTLVLFLWISLLTIQPAIARITETDIAPGRVSCRSEQVLTDEAGHKWDVMFFTETMSPKVSSLNLRLSGLSSSVYIQSRQPLTIDVEGDRYRVSDLLREKSPLHSIAQYDLKNVFSRIPIADLTVEIPLENGSSTLLSIPKTLVREWHEVAAKNPHLSPKIPSNIELVC